jgi:glycosyltransferase involved in cell wall biosynthesis
MTSQPAVSVITCTHNPRREYIDRVLAALKSQSLPLEQWEYLLIDNASDRQVSSEIDLSWHPNSRHIRENKLGLTPARLRGIREAVSDILVFVDDDNVLNPDYLEVTLQISKHWSIIGAWGGQIRGEFEIIPPDWTKPYWKNLGIREFDGDRWSNLLYQYETTPCGAGMCVRKVVAQHYAKLVQSDPKRFNLDRQGQLLVSGGDTDLAFTACDIGLGTGLFASLNLTHLIPATRLEEEYLLRLTEGLAYSNLMLGSLRDRIPRKQMGIHRRLKSAYTLITQGVREARFERAKNRGFNLGLKAIIPIEK